MTSCGNYCDYFRDNQLTKVKLCPPTSVRIPPEDFCDVFCVAGDAGGRPWGGGIKSGHKCKRRSWAFMTSWCQRRYELTMCWSRVAAKFATNNYHPRSAARVIVFSRFCLCLCPFVCLSVCQHDNSWTVRDIITKFLWHHFMVIKEAKFENGYIAVRGW